MATTNLVKAQSQELTEALTDEIVAEWLRYEAEENDASSNTVATYRKGLSVFTAWCRDNGLALAMVTPVDVAGFKTWLKNTEWADDTYYSVQTVNLRLTAVRRFYAWAVVTGKALINPAADVKGVKRKKSRTHKRDALTNGEVSKVLATCDCGTIEGLRDKVILVLMAYCGLRQIEIHRANIGDVRTKGDRLVIFVTGKGHTEGDDYLVIPMSQEPLVAEWLRLRSGAKPGDPLFVSLSNRSNGNRLSLRAIRYLVKMRYHQAGVVAGGQTKTTHSLRHSAITNAIRQGATPMQVQSMARHADYNTTLGYFHEVNRIDNPAEDLINYD